MGADSVVGCLWSVVRMAYRVHELSFGLGEMMLGAINGRYHN